MPPRRSTRSARPSVEPEPAPAPSKRKRGQSAALEEKENTIATTATTRTTRRSSSVRPSVNTATVPRGRGSLKEVVEDEEVAEAAEGEEEGRKAKKSRPSPEPEEDEEVKPKGRKSTAKSAAKKVVEEDEDSQPASRGRGRKASGSKKADEDEEQPPSKGRGRKPNAPAQKRASARSKKDISDGESASEPESDREEKPKKPKRKGSAKSQEETMDVEDDQPVSHNTDEDEEVPDSEGEELGSSRGRKPKVPANAKSRARQRVASDTSTPAAATIEQEDEEEEEQSLLDPPPVPQSHPSSVHPPTAELNANDSQTAEEPKVEDKGPKARLVIHKMALVNFKSYAGRQEIGPFHKSFSSIVGPNGSGKSNTIDALLFVFGYRASKMRQGKLSELIHNSGGREDIDECCVEVHFREILDLPGPDAYKVIPNSQLVVARTAYKNNTSRYTINGRSSNFTEVQALLKGRGIDLDHKRFLILQGEVESIAQMKPKAPTEHEDGLLEYLEDIIGTSSYKPAISASLAAMDSLSEDRAEKLGRLRIVEKEKKRLEEGKKEAEGWLRMHNEWVRATSRLWQWYLWKCLENEERFAEGIARLEKDLAEETDRNKDDITHLEMLEKHYEERGKAYEEVKAAAAEAVKDLAAHEKQEVGLEERRKHANGKAKKLKKSLQDDEHAKADATRAVKDSSEKMEREKRKVEEHEASLDKEEKVLEGIRDSLKDKTQVFHDQIEVKQKELQPWTAKINAKQAEINVATSERDALAKKAEGVREAAEEAKEAFEKLKEDQEAKVAELEEVKANKANVQKEVKAGEKKLQDTHARVQELRAKASSSRQKADEAKASQAANTSQNKVLDSLTRLRSAGRIDGFHGRLGSLGTIPDRYDVAVSTACGALNNLVVDTVEQGQACIEYLRKQNVGRASFIVLEKLSQTNGLDKIATPENVPRLFDLIKPKEPRFAPAFFKGVGNTLVADDLDQANRIAFGGQRRWRVVTLAGQLIDSSGTMSGGGNHVAKGGMSSKLAADAVRPETLRVYEQESEDAARLLEQALAELRRIEVEVEGLGKSGPQMDVALEKIGLDIKNGSKRIAEAEKRVRELKSQSKPDAGDLARISALEKEIASSTEELEALQEKSGKIERAIKDLEKKILEIGGAKLLTQKSKVDGLRLHINLANDEITKAEVAKAKAEKDSAKLKTTIEANSTSLQEIEGELEELNEQLAECERYVTQLRSKVEAAQAAAENSKDDLENLKSELDAKTEEIQAFRQKEMELQQAINDTKKEAAENDRALEHWRTEHDKLKLEEIDSDDEEEEDAETEADGDENREVNADAQVKDEPGEAPVPKKKARERTPSYELHIYSAEELARFKKREMIADTELLDEKLKNAKPNLSVLKEYRKREEEFLKRAKDLEHITNLRDEEKRKYDGLRKQRLDEFMAGFSLISMKLKEMYQMITLGGNAELELVDSMDPFSEGIIFSVMPPKKSWKNISNLSGGEKTLSSLALVFALHVFKPTPLYFMDEIDAALDFRNVSIVANYIKDRTKNAQFIIISLRNDMFELSHRLIGIYKTANATQSISIDNHALTAVPVAMPVAA